MIKSFKVYLIFLSYILIQTAYAAPIDDFVITVKTDNPGFTISEMFRIPTKSALTYNYNVDCNDDGINEATNQAGDYYCDYSAAGLNLGAGIYTIRIKDNTGTGDGFPSINFNNTFDRLKIISVEQWGIGIWTNMQRAFYGSENLVINASDVPDFSQVSTMESMFRRALLANPDTSMWDTSKVVNMKSLFNEAEIATPDTSQWDTHMVTDMSFMFRHAYLAEPDIRSWNVEQVGDFSGMFSSVNLPTAVYSRLLIEFNDQNLQASLTLDANGSYYCGNLAALAHANMIASDGWTINDLGECAVNDPGHDFVFTVDTSFTGVTSNTEYLIRTSSSLPYNYNVDCNNDGSLEATAQTGNYTCDYSLLGGQGIYTIRIIDNTGVGSGYQGFASFSSPTQTDQKKIIAIEQWGTAAWQTVRRAFGATENLLLDNTKDVPDFSQVESMEGMFLSSNITNLDTKYWDVSMVNSMSQMFNYAEFVNPDVSRWNTSNVIVMSHIFHVARNANPDVSNWDTSKVISMASLFSAASSANPDVSNWNTQMVTNMSSLFSDASSANPNVSNWDTSKVTTMNSMFFFNHLANPDVSNWDTSKVTDVSQMFAKTTLANPDTSTWDTSSITTMYRMFWNAVNANPNTNTWDTSSVTTMESMFDNADAANPDTSNWDTSSVTNMHRLFAYSDLANPDVSNWDTSSVTDMSSIFESNNTANPDTTGWNTSNVNNMERMFYSADLANPGTTNWNIAKVTNMTNMFQFVNLATITYDQLLVNFNNTVVETDIHFNGGNSHYCSTAAQNARNRLINDFNWTITDAGLCSNNAIFDDFILKINTENSGQTDNLKFNVRVKSGLNYNYNVDCDNDGIDEVTAKTSSYICNYSTPGTYIIRIKDNTGTGDGFPGFDYTTNFDRNKIISVLQWGTGKWQYLINAFKDTVNLRVTATDVPDLSNLSSLESMFDGAIRSNPDLSQWNVTAISNMNNIFRNVTLPTDLYDSLLLNFSAQILQTGVDFNGGNSSYCAIGAHDNITNISTGYGWVVSDSGIDANCAQSDDYFIFSVDTGITEAGSSNSTQFTIPTTGSGYNYDVICDAANPGTSTIKSLTANHTCNYPSTGIYTLKISTNTNNPLFETGFPHIYFNNEGDKLKIVEISQWGSGIWTSMESAFRGTSNMIVTAADAPNLSQVSDMSQMFRFASLANPNVSLWDTSNVTTMELMFNGALAATPNISNWDVSNVDNMDNMLLGLTLPTTIYDATLINFNLQNLLSSVHFNAGGSKYCAISAHDGLENTFGWFITDAGLDPNCQPPVEDIFSNGFEDVIIFKSQDMQVVYDFSQISVNELDQTPLLIAKGINNQHQPTLLIYLRNDLGQLQIRQDFLDEQNQWIQGLWESIYNTALTTISWKSRRIK